MKLLELKCTIIGIIIALVLTGLFNASYWFTLLVINNKPYSLNLACASIVVTLLGVIIDIIRSIKFDKPKSVIESDLTPKGYTTIFPDRDVSNTEQESSEVDRIKDYSITTDEENVKRSYQSQEEETILF